MGDCLWWCLVSWRCYGGVQTTRISNIRYIYLLHLTDNYNYVYTFSIIVHKQPKGQHIKSKQCPTYTEIKAMVDKVWPGFASMHGFNSEILFAWWYIYVGTISAWYKYNNIANIWSNDCYCLYFALQEQFLASRPTLARELVLFSWTMLGAVVPSPDWLTVPAFPLVATTASIMKTQVSRAKVS